MPGDSDRDSDSDVEVPSDVAPDPDRSRYDFDIVVSTTKSEYDIDDKTYEQALREIITRKRAAGPRVDRLTVPRDSSAARILEAMVDSHQLEHGLTDEDAAHALEKHLASLTQ